MRARNNVVHSYSDEVALDLDSHCNEELRAEIERDGVILYEAG